MLELDEHVCAHALAVRQVQHLHLAAAQLPLGGLGLGLGGGVNVERQVLIRVVHPLDSSSAHRVTSSELKVPQHLDVEQKSIINRFKF